MAGSYINAEAVFHGLARAPNDGIRRLKRSSPPWPSRVSAAVGARVSVFSSATTSALKKPTRGRAKASRSLAPADVDTRAGQLDPTQLVFIDDTATNTNMVRFRGRCYVSM